MEKRIIKFRGQRVDNNEWVYGYYVCDPEGGHRIYLKPFDDATSNTYYFVHGETVGQFSGLQDKAGDDIYEGDIVKEVYHPLGADKDIYEYSNVGIVEFSYGRFGLKYKISEHKRLMPDKCLDWQIDKRGIHKHPTQGADWFNYSVSWKAVEVIGNIFSNSELLNPTP